MIRNNNIKNKKKSSKSIIWIISIIFLVLILVYAINYYYNNQKLKKADAALYKGMLCIVSCPLEFNSTLNDSTINPECRDNCINLLPVASEPRNFNKNSKVVQAIVLCISESTKERSNCLKQKLELLEQKYPYLAE